MQEIVRGIDAFSQFFLKYDNFFFIHGKSFGKSILKPYFKDKKYVEFTNFSVNPKYEEVCVGLRKWKECDCDAIVAIGGGSAIDFAKCIKLYSGAEIHENFYEQKVNSNDVDIPLIAIPTTAGSGSEATRHAVIYFKGVKQSISYDCIIPNTVILVPEVLKSLPLYQKKCTLLDAICHAIESWWSINSTSESRDYSKKAIQLIKDNYRFYLQKGEACEEIMEAANLAGKAINITATTAPHAMSYMLTTLYQIPHGHAVAVSLPYIWEYMVKNVKKCTDERGSVYFKEVMKEIEQSVGREWFGDFLLELNICKPISDRKEEDVRVLVESVNLTRLKNNPIPLDKDMLKMIYNKVVENES